jgi:hypothetical protein
MMNVSRGKFSLVLMTGLLLTLPLSGAQATATPAPSVAPAASATKVPTDMAAMRPKERLLPETAAEKAAKIAAQARQSQRDFITQYVRCSAQTNNIERLACFDDIARDMGLATPAQNLQRKKILGTYGFWQVIESQDAYSRDNIYLKLDAISELRSTGGISTRPTLTLKCQSEKTEFYLDWKIALQSNKDGKTINVRYSVDTLPEQKGVWNLSDDSVAVYATDPAKMIREIRGHKKLVTILSAVNQLPQSAIFELDGFDNALAILIKRCYPNSPVDENSQGQTTPPATAATPP